MKRWLSPLRGAVEKVPLLAESFRLVRDNYKLRTTEPRALKKGFKLAGHPKMTSDNYEIEETAIIEGALGDADVFVDVGANIGYYTCLARSLGKRVLAFEPSMTSQKWLYKNLLANDMHDVEIIPVGLSSHVDLVKLYGTGGTASLVPGWSKSSSTYASVIPTTTLDDVLASRFLDERLFIKIDIEGAEYFCLEGARRTLARAIPPTWFVEIYPDVRGTPNPHFKATFQLFWNAGYSAREAVHGGTLVGPDDVDAWVSGQAKPQPGANYLFTKARQ